MAKEKDGAPDKRWICAVLVHAKEVDKLVKFYREVCEIPLEPEADSDGKHYGCQIRDVYFALHSAPRTSPRMSQGYRVAFAVDDFDAFIERLKERGVRVHMESIDTQCSKVAWFTDPENNLVEIISLSRPWVESLTRKRRAVKKR